MEMVLTALAAQTQAMPEGMRGQYEAALPTPVNWHLYPVSISTIQMAT